MCALMRVLFVVLISVVPGWVLAWDQPGNYWGCYLFGYGSTQYSSASGAQCAAQVCANATNGWTQAIGTYPTFQCQSPGCESGGCQSATFQVTQYSGCQPGYSEWFDPALNYDVCVPSGCVGAIGKEVDINISWLGPATDASPTTACYGGCKAIHQPGVSLLSGILGGRLDMTLADGTNYNGFHGVFVVSNPALPCGTGDRVGQATSNLRDGPGSGSASSTGASGYGSGGGGATTSGQGWNKTDSLNLTKIATNTAIAAESAGTGGSTCGGAGQPACATTVGEGNTATSDANTSANLGDLKTAAQGDYGTITGALSGASPTMLGAGGSRWLFSFSSLIPAGSCTWNAGTLSVAGGLLPASQITFDGCEYQAQVQGILSWVFGLLTMMGLWFIVFGRKE